MARTPEATRERVLKLAKQGKTPVQIASAVKTSRNNVYLHLRRLREEGRLEEPTDAKTNGHAKHNGSGEKPDPKVEAAITVDGDGPSPSKVAIELIDSLRGQASEASTKLSQRHKDIDTEIALLYEHIENLKAESNEIDKAVAQLEAFTTA